MKKKEKIWWSASTLVDKNRNVFKGPSVFIWWHAKKVLWRRDRLPTPVFLGFPCGSAGKESTCNVGDLGSIPGLGRSPGEEKGYTFQYFQHSEIPTPVFWPREFHGHGVAKSRTWLSHFHFMDSWRKVICEQKDFSGPTHKSHQGCANWKIKYLFFIIMSSHK